jgi:hypothetical protein
VQELTRVKGARNTYVSMQEGKCACGVHSWKNIMVHPTWNLEGEMRVQSR